MFLFNCQNIFCVLCLCFLRFVVPDEYLHTDILLILQLKLNLTKKLSYWKTFITGSGVMSDVILRELLPKLEKNHRQW